MRGIGRGVAGRITLAERSRCFPWMFKREEKATPRPRFPHRTWGTLRVLVSQEHCAVVKFRSTAQDTESTPSKHRTRVGTATTWVPTFWCHRTIEMSGCAPLTLGRSLCATDVGPE